MQITSRKEAKRLGLTTYWTGRPCKRGHIAARYTGSGSCVECKRQDGVKQGQTGYWHRYYRDNRQIYIDRAKAAYLADPGAQDVRSKKWAENNRDQIRESQALYRLLYPEQVRATQAAHAARNPGYSRTYWQRRRVRLKDAKRPDGERIATYEDDKRLSEAQDDCCAYCGSPLSGGGELDHKTPISRGGRHVVENLQWLCRPCNRRKGKKTHEEFVEYLRMMARIKDGVE